MAMHINSYCCWNYSTSTDIQNDICGLQLCMNLTKALQNHIIHRSLRSEVALIRQTSMSHSANGKYVLAANVTGLGRILESRTTSVAQINEANSVSSRNMLLLSFVVGHKRVQNVKPCFCLLYRADELAYQGHCRAQRPACFQFCAASKLLASISQNPSKFDLQ